MSSGHDTLILGHGGGGGSQPAASVVVTVKVPTTLRPFPAVTLTRTSCGPRFKPFRSQSTDLPSPEIVPSVVKYSKGSEAPAGSFAVTTNVTSGLSDTAADGKNGQIRIVVNDEVNESMDGGRLGCRLAFCSKPGKIPTTGKTRENEMTNRNSDFG